MTSFFTSTGGALVLGLEFPLLLSTVVLLLDSRPARDKYCCLNSSVVKAAPVLRTPDDEPVDDSVDALESELAERVDFFKTPPASV